MVQRATVLLFQTHVITPSQSVHRVDDQIRSTMQVMQYRAPERTRGMREEVIASGERIGADFPGGGGYIPLIPAVLLPISQQITASAVFEGSARYGGMRAICTLPPVA